MSYICTTGLRISSGVRFSRFFSSKGKFPKCFNTTMGAHGPLVDGPDYTFVDGRKTPLTSGKRRRANEQLQITSRVIQLLHETNYAIESHKKRQEEVQQNRQDILDSKLKPKSFKNLE